MALINQVASVAWSAVNSARRRCYDLGVFKSARLPARVMSVGNLQAGGSGKTPLVAKIAQEAAKKNLTVLILLRGVGGAWENSGGVIAPQSNDGTSAPEASDAGDEALLLHWRCPLAWIAVGKGRVGSFHQAVKMMGKNPDLVILDDGFQHLQIHRDVDLLCITSRSSSETPFREFVKQAERAHAWIFSKGTQVPFNAGDFRWIKLIRKFPTPSGDQKYFFVSAISQPNVALEELEKTGYRIEKYSFFSDHYLWKQDEANVIENEAKELGLKVLLTGKDFVKWPGDRSLVEVVEPDIEITEGSDQWNRVLWG